MTAVLFYVSPVWGAALGVLAWWLAAESSRIWLLSSWWAGAATGAVNATLFAWAMWHFACEDEEELLSHGDGAGSGQSPWWDDRPLIG